MYTAYIYICIYVYVYICIYVYVYMCIYVYMYICICVTIMLFCPFFDYLTLYFFPDRIRHLACLIIGEFFLSLALSAAEARLANNGILQTGKYGNMMITRGFELINELDLQL